MGGKGDDAIDGQGGRDALHGEEGDDRIYGGFDDDRLVGGAGDDLLDGNTGLDRFSGWPRERLHRRAVQRARELANPWPTGSDCGPGHDTVKANTYDRIGRDCEVDQGRGRKPRAAEVQPQFGHGARPARALRRTATKACVL